MHRVKFLSVFVLLALLLSASSAGVMGQEPPEQVPVRIPPDQAPEYVNVAGVSERVQVLSSESEAPADKPAPEKVPDDQVPQVVNKVGFREAITVPVASVSSGQMFGTLDSGTVTLSYGFYWFQLNPSTVAVAGYARTESDFCAQSLFAKATLYRDVEHDGTWEYMEEDESSATGACVTDSGEARTGYWTAPNNTDWKVRTLHRAQWDGNWQSWERQKVDSFP